MNKKDKLKQLYDKLNSLQNKEVLPSSEVDTLLKEQVLNFASELRENPTIKVLKRFNDELTKFKKDFDLIPITELIKEVETEMEENQKSISAGFEKKLAVSIQEVKKVIPVLPEPPKPFDSTPILRDLANLQKDLENKKDFDPIPLQTDIDSVRLKIELLTSEIEKDTTTEEVKRELEKKIEELRRELITRINSINNRGGGNANRDIRVNSNSVLAKYTDINLQNSSSIGWLTSVDETNKRINFQASVLLGGGGSGTPGGANKQVQYNNAGAFGGDPAFLWSSSILSVGQPGSVRGAIDLAGATAQTVRVQVPSTAGAWVLTLPANDGGAGQYLLTDGNGITQWASVTAVGGSGITRSVSVISVSSTLAAAAATDYVIFANVGIQATLPTAISNSNAYSLKNNSASSVLVATTAGETIDGSATALLPTNNEMLTFISNNSVWGVF